MEGKLTERGNILFIIGCVLICIVGMIFIGDFPWFEHSWQEQWECVEWEITQPKLCTQYCFINENGSRVGFGSDTCEPKLSDEYNCIEAGYHIKQEEIKECTKQIKVRVRR